MKLSPVKRWSLLVMLTLVLGSLFSFSLTSRGVGPDLGIPGKNLPESKVAIVKSNRSTAAEIREEDIRSMVREAVELAGGFQELIRDGQIVAIKPNLVYQRDYTHPGWRGDLLPEEANGVTTDWRVTKAIVELVREYNPHGKVYIMEGAAVAPTKEAMAALKYTGEFIPGVDEFIALEEDSGAWGDLNSPGLVKVSLPHGLLHQEYYLNKKYREADVLISVPCLKNHWKAVISGGIKNVGIGATPANVYGVSVKNIGRNNMVNHDSLDLHKWIHDFYSCRPVDFVIMDGLQGIQNGPTPCFEVSGTTELAQDQMNLGLILAGRDAVAVDTIEALVMGWDPLSVAHLKYLAAGGMGNLDTGAITVMGKPVDMVRKKFAGVIPSSGGARITDEKAPQLKIRKLQNKDRQLTFSLSVDKETRKVEVYLNGILRKPVITSEFAKIKLDLRDMSAGHHEITVRAYDRFLNCAVVKANLDLLDKK